MTPRLPTLPLVTLLLILFGLLSSYYGAYAATSAQDIAVYLAAHNGVRAQHGATALVWNQTLADAGQRWVDSCKFQHSGGSLGPYGENLAAGTGGSYDSTAAVKSWTDEAPQYDPQNPAPSHFTQVVWKSMQVGVAKYFACEYYPAGNVIGEFPCVASRVLVLLAAPELETSIYEVGAGSRVRDRYSSSKYFLVCCGSSMDSEAASLAVAQALRTANRRAQNPRQLTRALLISGMFYFFCGFLSNTSSPCFPSES
uniref:Repressed by TUP1 protein 4 n=1 Tax=Ganoderma boninense TaxID=34458 RepID=A0A5K1JXN2_9APHY|nr:Repressed by TUP1 protein 4 [Ganoderma boninense]